MSTSVGLGSDRLVEGARAACRPTLARRLALALATLAVATLALAAHANAFVYWANLGTNTIGSTGFDGFPPVQNFIGAVGPVGVAVDGAHVYWANGSTDTIGRADLDGDPVDQGFITGANGPTGVAVDGADIYWANQDSGTIGRANLDGTGANQSFITGASLPFGVAVDTPTIAHLIQYVEALNLPSGTENSLLKTLDKAQKALDAGNVNGACSQLGLFIIDVHDLRGAGTIPRGVANLLVARVQAVQSSIGCGAGASTCAGSEATIVGTGRRDKLRGTTGDDVIAARGGDDTVVGLQGDDLICGGGGGDVLRGKGGDDALSGGPGKDVLRGGGGSNRCRGGGGSDSKHQC